MSSFLFDGHTKSATDFCVMFLLQSLLLLPCGDIYTSTFLGIISSSSYVPVGLFRDSNNKLSLLLLSVFASSMATLAY